MGRSGHEGERAVADRLHHAVQVLRVPDALLRVVETPEPARVALDGGLGAPQLVDVAHREDVRAGRLVRGLREGDHEAHDRLALAELHDVARLERHLPAIALVELDPALTADDGRAVGRSEIAQQVALVARYDARVLARHVLVGQHHVVAGRASEPDEPRRRFMTRPSGEPLRDLQTDHRQQAYIPPRATGSEREREREGETERSEDQEGKAEKEKG